MAQSLRLPPQNLEAEQAVLGGLLIDKDAIIKVADILVPADFYRDEHTIIYRAILELYEKRQPIDALTISEILESQKTLKKIGGATYLAELVNNTATAANVASYAQIIRHKATLRNLITAGSHIAELGFVEADEVAGLLDEAEKTLFKVSDQLLHQAFVPIKDVLATTFDRIDELHKHKGKLRGIATGYNELDNLMAGLQPSDLVTLAARPAMGKSSLALNIAAHAAIRVKVPVAIFSLEMSKDQLVDRLLVSEGGIDSWKLRTGNLNDDDFPRIGYAMGVLSEAPIFIDDSPLLNVIELRAKARRLQVEHGLGLIVLDYIQLMEGQRRSGDANRVQEISEISRGLKAVARELNVPILALSQLSRAVEHRHPPIPQLADLRESGSIEQDSDVVMFIYREDYYDNKSERKNIADIFIKKHRHGPVGQIELYFVPEQMRFMTIERKRATEKARDITEKE